jgi:hypothetical protein
MVGHMLLETYKANRWWYKMIIFVLGVLVCSVHIFVVSCLRGCMCALVLSEPVCSGIKYNVMFKLSRYRDCSSCSQMVME